VALKYAVQVNGVDSLFLTKLDVLDELDEIQVATAYESAGGCGDRFFIHADALSRVRPVYQTLPGWRTNLAAMRRLSDLPLQVRSYLNFIEDFTGVGVSHVSLGGEREQTIEINR